MIRNKSYYQIHSPPKQQKRNNYCLIKTVTLLKIKNS